MASFLVGFAWFMLGMIGGFLLVFTIGLVLIYSIGARNLRSDHQKKTFLYATNPFVRLGHRITNVRLDSDGTYVHWKDDGVDAAGYNVIYETDKGTWTLYMILKEAEIVEAPA